MWVALFWGFVGGWAVDLMRAPGPWKARAPLVGTLPTLILGPPEGQGLLDRVAAFLPVGQLGST